MNVDLFEYTIQFWEHCCSRGITNLPINEVFEEPNFLFKVLDSGNAEGMRRLLSIQPLRNALNGILADFSPNLVSTISRWLRYESVPGFKYSPYVLKDMLDHGLSPSRGLLVWCAFACSSESIDNLRLIVREKSLRGVPFSSTDFSLCMKQIFEIYWRIYPHDSYCNCSMEDYGDTFRAVGVWGFFTDHGAACDSASILKLAY